MKGNRIALIFFSLTNLTSGLQTVPEIILTTFYGFYKYYLYRFVGNRAIKSFSVNHKKLWIWPQAVVTKHKMLKLIGSIIIILRNKRRPGLFCQILERICLFISYIF